MILVFFAFVIAALAVLCLSDFLFDFVKSISQNSKR